MCPSLDFLHFAQEKLLCLPTHLPHLNSCQVQQILFDVVNFVSRPKGNCITHLFSQIPLRLLRLLEGVVVFQGVSNSH